MTKQIEKSIKFRIGIIFHGSKIWLSELLSYILAFILLATLLTLSIATLQNELEQSRRAGLINSLKTETVQLKNELAILKQKNNIYEILIKYAYKKVSLNTISMLTKELYLNSHQFGYDPLLLLAVIKVESVFDPRAQGRYRSGDLSGAFGLMQLKFSTAQETAYILNMGVLTQEDLLKPDINLILGTAYLTKLISKFQSFKLGLIAYNIGPGTVNITMKNKEPLPMNYYRKVISNYFLLKKDVETSSTNDG